MRSNRAEFVLVLVTVIAAAGWLFSKNALQDIPPFSFIALRFSLASCVLLLFAFPQIRSLSFDHFLRSAFTGAVLGLTLLFWIIGLKRATSIGEGAFIVSLTVIVVPLVSRVLFSERIPWTIPLALLPALAGLALLTLDNNFVVESGQWYFLAATIGFALHLNLSSHFVTNVPFMANTCVQLFMIGMIAAIAALFTHSFTVSFGASAWGWLLASVFIATSLRFALQNYALRLISPNHAAMIFLLEPVWTAIIGVLLLGEVLSQSKVAGCMFIFTALILFRLPMLKDGLKHLRKVIRSK